MEERTGKDRMNNKVVELLEQKQLGWISSYINTTGRKFVDLLTEVLWYIDGCHKTLEGRRLSVPHIISEICGYNKPEIYSHKRVPIEAMKLCTFATSLFKIGEGRAMDQSREILRHQGSHYNLGNQFVSRVFVRANHACADQVETAYYSSRVFDDVCVYCGYPNDIIKVEEAADILPTCGSCFNDQTKPKVFKCKRNQMQPASKKKQNPHIDSSLL